MTKTLEVMERRKCCCKTSLFPIDVMLFPEFPQHSKGSNVTGQLVHYNITYQKACRASDPHKAVLIACADLAVKLIS